MIENYPDILARVLVHEGGYSNHAADPGGATMKGVTQAVYDAFRVVSDLPKRSVRKIETPELEAIYDRQYWDKVVGDLLPSGIDYAVFDAAVNSGPAQAIKWLQRSLGKLYDGKVDGIIGLKTLSAVKRLNDRDALLVDFAARRMTFLRRLRHWPQFKDGWTTRVAQVKAHSRAMARV